MNQKAHALYGEVLGGVKVKIWKNISMGWDFRYRFKFKGSKGTNSDPWFIPGYGASSNISASFSLIYTIPLKRNKKDAIKDAVEAIEGAAEGGQTEIPQRENVGGENSQK